MNKPLRVGLAGVGTVGGGVVRLLTENAERITAQAGRPIMLAAVSALQQPDLPTGIRWESDAVALAQSPELDVVVEAIGGYEGIARKVVETALKNGKHVVTANKALLAHHGFALAQLAEQQSVTLLWEAAVGGAMPVVRGIRDALSGDVITGIEGILNGTCNYILSTMTETGRAFADVLADAQAQGFAEADPSTDVDGFDTAHKITLLAALAFGRQPDLAGVALAGIRTITSADIQAAREEGQVIKLLAHASLTPEGRLMQWVRPCRVPQDSRFGATNGSFNALSVTARYADTLFFSGRGAGSLPTASAVVSDLVTLARGGRPYAFGVPTNRLTPKATL